MVRARMTRGRALLLVIVSGLTLAGVIVLAAGWITVGVASFQAAADPQGGCLAGLEQPDARIRYDILPPRAVCTWASSESSESSGPTAQQTVVVADAPWAVAGAAAAGVGIVGLAAWWAVGRSGRGRRDDRGRPAR